MRSYEVWPGGDGQLNKPEKSGDGEMKDMECAMDYGSYNSIFNGAQYVTPLKFIGEKSKCGCLAQEIGCSAPNSCRGW